MIMQKEERVIIAPRSLKILLIQYMSMAPFSAAIIILFVIFTSNVSSKFNDILIILVAFILPLFLIGFFMLYFPQQYKTLIIFDIEKNILRKVIKKRQVQIFNIDTAQSIISKTTKTNFGCKYNLILEGTGNNSHIIFNENTPFGVAHWEAFSIKLSTMIGLPLKKEYWVKDLNGKLSGMKE
jgi:hypothetical protein